MPICSLRYATTGIQQYAPHRAHAGDSDVGDSDEGLHMVYAAGEAGACLQQLKSLAGAATSANMVCEFDNHNVTQNPMCISESHVHFI